MTHGENWTCWTLRILTEFIAPKPKSIFKVYIRPRKSTHKKEQQDTQKNKPGEPYSRMDIFQPRKFAIIKRCEPLNLSPYFISFLQLRSKKTYLFMLWVRNGRGQYFHFYCELIRNRSDKMNPPDTASCTMSRNVNSPTGRNAMCVCVVSLHGQCIMAIE